MAGVACCPDLHGSYEGCPPTLIDVAVRDRRWAQGNVQHLRIVGTRGLPWVSRLHLAMGAYAYFSSALWALSLLVGVVLSLQSAYTLPVYFPDAKTLFPVWPVIDPTKAFYLFLVTLAVLLLPKVLGIAVAMLRPARRRAPTGRGPVAGRLARRDAVLDPDRADPDADADPRHLRDPHSARIPAGPLSVATATRHELSSLLQFHAGHLAVGMALTIVCLLASIYVAAWMGPIIVGLLLSVAISHRHVEDGAGLARQGSGNT